MAEKDIVSKTLESYNDVFADMVNVFLFNGRQVVSPDELSSADIESHYKADGKIRTQERDVYKLWKNNLIKFSLIGFENQTDPNKFMPVRVLSYDGASYRDQLNKNFLINDEKRGKLCYPVITFVLYFGSDNWNFGTELYDCVYVAEELRPFVNNYKINLYSLKDMDDDKVKEFRSDFRIIAEFFSEKKTDDRIPSFSDKKLDHPQETLDMISIFSGDNRYLDVYNEMVENKTKGDIFMSNIYSKMLDKAIQQATDKAMKEGRAEGMKQGRAEGMQQGRAEGMQQGRAEGMQQGRAEGMQQGRAEGMKQGMQQGMQKGMEKGKYELVKSLINLGRSIKEIADFFKTDEAEIENILSFA